MKFYGIHQSRDTLDLYHMPVGKLFIAYHAEFYSTVCYYHLIEHSCGYFRERSCPVHGYILLHGATRGLGIEIHSRFISFVGGSHIRVYIRITSLCGGCGSVEFDAVGAT